MCVSVCVRIVEVFSIVGVQTLEKASKKEQDRLARRRRGPSHGTPLAVTCRFVFSIASDPATRFGPWVSLPANRRGIRSCFFWLTIVQTLYGHYLDGCRESLTLER